MKVWKRAVAVLSLVAAASAQTTAPQTPHPDPATEGAQPASRQTAPAQTPVPDAGAAAPAPQPVAPVPPSPIIEQPPLAMPTPPPTRKAPAPSDPAAEKNPDVSTATASSTYVIGLLDVLSVRVWGQPNLSGTTSVRDDGMISMQLIGEVKADGLTCQQLKEVITKRLTEFLNNPEVNVEVLRNNSKKYTVAGNGAGRPGTFPLNGKMTIFEALTAAGGFKDFSNPKKIYLLRVVNGQPKRFPFNYKDALVGKHPEQNIEVQNGDLIVVPE